MKSRLRVMRKGQHTLRIRLRSDGLSDNITFAWTIGSLCIERWNSSRWLGRSESLANSRLPAITGGIIAAQIIGSGTMMFSTVIGGKKLISISLGLSHGPG